MSEWWTYRISDFLLFSPRTYYRLVERYNREVWPLQILTTLAGLVILILALRRSGRGEGRVIAAILASLWLWVAWAFHLQRYATINWAAKWFAAAFVIEALLLVWTGVARNQLTGPSAPHLTQWAGIGLFLLALFGSPIVWRSLGTPWTFVELFGVMPDPTALATLGLVLFLGERIRISLLVIPFVWCGISAATLYAMKSPSALVIAAAGTIGLVAAVWRRVRRTRPASLA